MSIDRRGFFATVGAIASAAVLPKRATKSFKRDTTGFNYDDLYISPEAMEDVRNWNVDQILAQKPCIIR